ncbi:EcsC family protein [Phenylobacterium terrae]|uniref:EcsC family protein n=1 Tax=Phenylobacterium terrae TaxID=2665495 RepID=A0ABW4MYH6_9CAUL
MTSGPPVFVSETAYEHWAQGEVARWREKMLSPPNAWNRATRGVQQRITRAIPEKVHQAVTAVMERMTRGILVGADVTTADPLQGLSLEERDRRAADYIKNYRTTAAVEGGVAGAGGFLMAAADFPILIGIKIKLLFDLAAIYGHSGEVFGERVFILHLFELAFSSPEHRADVFRRIEDWDPADCPTSFEAFDWRRFQQEYRDYIDLAKLAQLLPVVGAPVGAVVNWRLLDRLGQYAINGYRMRWLAGR